MSIEDWGTETGLLTDYEGEVVDAWFGIDANYNAETSLLFLKMKTNKEERPEHEERYSCGGGWGSYDGGHTVEHADGAGKKFNMNSQYGKLLGKVFEVGAGEALAGRGSPKQASVWVGTKWLMTEITNSWKDRTTGEQKVSTKNFPSKFLGIAGEAAPASNGNGAAATTAAATPTAATTTTKVAMPDDLIAKLTAMAAATPDYLTWLDNALVLDEVTSNPDFVGVVSDEAGFYAAIKGA